MKRRTPARRVAAGLATALLSSLGSPDIATAQRPLPVVTCPAGTDAIVAAGWAAYRADSITVAARRFADALARCPEDHDATLGRAYVLLRDGDVEAADALFHTLARRTPASADAWEGVATTSTRRGRPDEAISAWRRVLALAPAHREARAQLDRLAPGWSRVTSPLVKRRAATLDLTLRVRGEGFELRRDGAWTPFYMQGVNLGLAMPGKWPSEFPADSALYAKWLGMIGEMHANTLRAYTILPPEFYRALRGHNLTHPRAPLYLVHGVWTELPPRDDFNDRGFNAGFAEEIRRVVDLLHGAAEFPVRPGHSGGRYEADVSPWTIGYILGREWEPYSVVGFNADSAAARSHAGTHLVLANGTPTDAWMVRQCDYLLTYEEETYNAQRPIAYSNWPTTDPIVHRSETSYAQQMRFRGIEWTYDPRHGPLHEEEGVALDPSLVRTTARNVAGWFASYHVYPYYPDFLILDRGYNLASSSLGRSNYFGYLQDLRRVHRGIPLVISEFGVPSSRGDGHQQPQGWDHGGLDETQQAAAYVRLAREIREAGAAGAIAFAWLDEWFKKNWIVVDFELPMERERLWHNMMDPEEHYGLLAMRPGTADRVPELGGDAARWRAFAAVQAGAFIDGDSAVLRAGQDEGFVYLALESPAWRGRRFPWGAQRLELAIDTHDPARGQRFLPGGRVRSAVGFEFVVEINGPADAQLKVTPDYQIYASIERARSGPFYGEPFRRPVLSVARDDGALDSLWSLTNRPRFMEDGTEVPAMGLNVGRLRHARASEHSNADWWYDERAGMLQLRLPWAMLNVTDPSSRRVLTESDPEQALGRRPGAPPSIWIGSPTEGFRFGVLAYRPGRGVTGALPALDDRGEWPLARFHTWTWPTWEEPTWHEYLKPSYRALQQLWGAP